jgi:hypothetical protein
MSARLAPTKRKPSQAKVLKSITTAAGRRGISIKAIGDEIVVAKGSERHAFPSAVQAAAFLLACGEL